MHFAMLLLRNLLVRKYARYSLAPEAMKVLIFV